MFRAPTAARLVRSSLVRASQASQLRAASTAISNPTLNNIEKRWETMPLQEQAELWMALRDRMTVPWNELTLQEKKAAYWVAFGPHGPRAEAPPGEGKRVAIGTALGVLASVALFAFVRMFAGPPPSTMTKEWQEATDEYLKAQNAEPITGISSGTGVGSHVQSPPKGPE